LVLVDTDDDDVGLLLGVVGGARRAGEEAVEHDERGQAPVKRLGHKHGPFGWTRFSDRCAARIRVVSEERENGNDPWHAPVLVILTDIANQSTQIQPPIRGSVGSHQFGRMSEPRASASGEGANRSLTLAALTCAPKTLLTKNACVP